MAARISSSAQIFGTDEDVFKGGMLCTPSASVMGFSLPLWPGLELEAEGQHFPSARIFSKLKI